MSHRMKYTLKQKISILNEYDHGKATKRIAEEYQMPISTVLYFIRNRSRFEFEITESQDDDNGMDFRLNLSNQQQHDKRIHRIIQRKNDSSNDHQHSLKRKRLTKLLKSESASSSDDNDNDDDQQQKRQNQSSIQQIRIRKIPYEMKLKIIKAWENRDQITGCIDNGGGGVGWSMRKIAERFGVSSRSVSRCIAKRNDLKLSMSSLNTDTGGGGSGSNNHNSDEYRNHQIVDEFDIIEDDDDEDTDSIAIQPNASGTIDHHSNIDDSIDQRPHSSSFNFSMMIPNSNPEIMYENKAQTEVVNRQSIVSNLISLPEWIDSGSNNGYHSLDEELVISINEIFDHLKHIRIISKRLSSPLNSYALEFTETMLNTANNYVDRLFRSDKSNNNCNENGSIDSNDNHRSKRSISLDSNS